MVLVLEYVCVRVCACVCMRLCGRRVQGCLQSLCTRARRPDKLATRSGGCAVNNGRSSLQCCVQTSLARSYDILVVQKVCLCGPGSSCCRS